MSTHLRSFLRRTPLESLRAYLDDVSATGFAEVDWEAPRPSLVDTLIESIPVLDDPARDRVYSDVDRIGQFMNEHGRRVLRGVLPADPEVLDAFDALEDVTACALLVLNRQDEGFENALALLYAQRLLNGRDWTGLDFEPGATLEVLKRPSITELESRLGEIFAADGPPPRLAVDRFTWREPDRHGLGSRVCEQFTIYFEAPPEAELAFESGSKVGTRIVRRVQEGALVFDAQARTLDVVARGAGKARRRQIAEAFVETILAPGAKLSTRARRTLALDTLKHPPMFDIRPDDGVRSVEVTRLALGSPDFGAIATFEVRGREERRADGDLYERAERAFGRGGLPAREGWPVLSARLRIVFEPEKPKGRAKTVTFELKAPDRTNLRDQIELHRRIADTLLERWGLYAAEG